MLDGGAFHGTAHSIFIPTHASAVESACVPQKRYAADAKKTTNGSCINILQKGAEKISYSIIFETIFVKLTDGRLLHLDRSGCNNDNAGRSRDDFTGKIYTVEALHERIKRYMRDAEPTSGYQLKIGGKWRSYYQYGEHLMRMSKRALPYMDFAIQRRFEASRYDGAQVYKPVEKIYTAKEFDDVYYNYLYSGEAFEYRRLLTTLTSENEIVKALDNNEPVSFFVGKNHRG